MALAFIGQSNCQGVGDSTLSPRPAPGTAYEYLYVGGVRPTGQLVELKDPMSRHQLPLYRSQTGSLVPMCALRYHELTGLIPVVSHLGASGTSVISLGPPGGTDWAPGNVLRARFVEQTNAMLAHAGIERLAWITVTLGETDGYQAGRYPTQIAQFPAGMVVPGVYDAATGYPNGYPNPNRLPDLYTAYRGLIEDLRQHFPGVRFNINQTGVWEYMEDFRREGVKLMWPVQEHLARTIPGVYCEMKDAKYFRAFGYLQDDGVHYNQMGLNYVGRLDAQIMANH